MEDGGRGLPNGFERLGLSTEANKICVGGSTEVVLEGWALFWSSCQSGCGSLPRHEIPVNYHSTPPYLLTGGMVIPWP